MRNLTKIMEFMEQDFPKAQTLIQNVLSKKLGTTIYQSTEDYAFKTKNGEFLSTLYFIGDTGNAIRMNWNKDDSTRKIISVDVLKGDKHYLIDLKGANINKVFDVVVGTYLEPEKVVGGEVITEMKKFIKLQPLSEAIFTATDGTPYASRRSYLRSLLAKGYTDEQVWEVLPKADMNPKFLDKQRELLNQSEGNYNPSSVSVDYAPKEQVINQPKVENVILDYNELEKEYWSDPDTIYDDLVGLVTAVGKGNVNSLIISGDGGVGKTFRTKQVLKNLGINNIKDSGQAKDKGYVVLSGGGSPFGIYQKIFQHRHRLIIFDDFDDVWKDTKSVNILKGILDTTDPRQVDWASSSKAVFKVDGVPDADLDYDERYTEEGIFPDSFLFHGRCIFITNMYKYQLDDAVLSRSLAIDVAIKQKDMVKLMGTLAPQMDLGISEGDLSKLMNILSEDVSDYKDELPKEIVKNGIQRKMKTLRTMVNSAGIMKSGVPNWERLVKRYA